MAGAFLSYLEQLEQGEITVLFGTDGLEKEALPPTLQGRAFYSDPAEIRHAVNLCVWSSEAGTGAGFGAFVDALQESHKMVHRVIVFGPTEEEQWVKTICSAAVARRIKPTFAFVPEPEERRSANAAPPSAMLRAAGIKRLAPAAGKWLDSSLGIGRGKPPARINAAVLSAAALGGEVIICEKYI